jgi:arylsulfatase A-like enzyme
MILRDHPCRDDKGRGHGALSRRTFLKETALGAAVTWAGSPAAWPAPAVARNRPPNLLFINVDQLSTCAMPQFGCTHVETPNLDRLARRGTSFELSHCADPLCSPSRACWFTGRAPTEHGMLFNDLGFRLRPDIPDLGGWLRRAGYETFHVGKWHIPGREVGSSFNVLHEGSTIGDHGDAATARACEALLRNRPAGGDPFFLVAGLMNPHDICEWVNVLIHWTKLDFQSPQRFPYPWIEGQLPPLSRNFNFDPHEPEFFVARVRRPQEHYTGTWCERMWRYYAWSYQRQVEMVDAAIGRILDALENSPHADNTLVVFSSDHGDAMGRHRLIHKMSLYDAAVRVPMIVAWPGQVAENRIDPTHLVSGFDLTPTLCDYAGTAPPPDMRGRSLRGLIEGRGSACRDYVVAHSFVVGRMVRSARYKYIAYQGDKTDQLFDMAGDPWETRNLAADPAAAGPLAEHRRMLAEWESQLKPLPQPPGGWLKQIFEARPKRKAKPGKGGTS